MFPDSQPFHNHIMKGKERQCHPKEEDKLFRKALSDRKRKWEAFFFQIPVKCGEKRSNAYDFTCSLLSELWK